LKILGFDLETNDLDPTKAVITEVGAVLVEITDKVRELARVNHLVYHPKYPALTEEITDITGITDELLKAEGVPPMGALAEAIELFEQADVIMAHNAEFDHAVFHSFAPKVKGLKVIPQRTWACTWRDVPYPKKFRCKKLAHLAFDHGMQVDVTKLHRAVNDIELMFALVLPRYDLQAIVAEAKLPWAFVSVKIPPPWEDGGKGRDFVSALGYGWETPKGMIKQLAPKYPKTWVQRIRAPRVGELIEKSKPYVATLLP
jgi:hypothetical protein